MDFPGAPVIKMPRFQGRGLGGNGRSAGTKNERRDSLGKKTQELRTLIEHPVSIRQ